MRESTCVFFTFCLWHVIAHILGEEFLWDISLIIAYVSLPVQYCECGHHLVSKKITARIFPLRKTKLTDSLISLVQQHTKTTSEKCFLF